MIDVNLSEEQLDEITGIMALVQAILLPAILTKLPAEYQMPVSKAFFEVSTDMSGILVVYADRKNTEDISALDFYTEILPILDKYQLTAPESLMAKLTHLHSTFGEMNESLMEEIQKLNKSTSQVSSLEKFLNVLMTESTHDCDNCHKKGNCPIEDKMRAMRLPN